MRHRSPRTRTMSPIRNDCSFFTERQAVTYAGIATSGSEGPARPRKPPTSAGGRQRACRRLLVGQKGPEAEGGRRHEQQDARHECGRESWRHRALRQLTFRVFWDLPERPRHCYSTERTRSNRSSAVQQVAPYLTVGVTPRSVPARRCAIRPTARIRAVSPGASNCRLCGRADDPASGCRPKSVNVWPLLSCTISAIEPLVTVSPATFRGRVPGAQGSRTLRSSRFSMRIS